MAVYLKPLLHSALIALLALMNKEMIKLNSQIALGISYEWITGKVDVTKNFNMLN